MPPVDIAKHLNRGVGSITNKAQKRGTMITEAADVSTMEGREFNSDGQSATVTVNGLSTEIQNLDDLIRVCKIGPEWRVKTWKQKAYQGYIKDASGKIEKTQLFSVTANLESSRELCAILDEIRAVAHEIRGQLSPPPPRASQPSESHILASVNVTDLHLGKLAWAPESGENWDLDIARRVYWDAIHDIAEKIAVYRPERIILTVGSDLLNADNLENTTTGGTPQSTDGRQTKTFRAAWQIKRETIEYLRGIAPVHVVVFPGNHDQMSSFAIGEVLSVCFEGYSDVTIDNTPTNMKYVKWGLCLLAYVHGNGVKPRDIVETTAVEKSDWWGITEHRGAESGHLHDQAVFEYRGMTVYRNPALCPPEDWHKAKMFVGKMRAVHARIWDKQHGAIAQLSSCPLAPQRMPGIELG